MSAVPANHFAHNLITLRYFHGHEMKHVAQKLSINTERYRHWEQGKAFPQSPVYYVYLCNLYKFKDLLKLFTTLLTDEDLHAYYNEQEAQTGGAIRL